MTNCCNIIMSYWLFQQFFPYDIQTCVLKLGSWTYDGFKVGFIMILFFYQTKNIKLLYISLFLIFLPFSKLIHKFFYDFLVWILWWFPKRKCNGSTFFCGNCAVKFSYFCDLLNVFMISRKRHLKNLNN